MADAALPGLYEAGLADGRTLGSEAAENRLAEQVDQAVAREIAAIVEFLADRAGTALAKAIQRGDHHLWAADPEAYRDAL